MTTIPLTLERPRVQRTGRRQRAMVFPAPADVMRRTLNITVAIIGILVAAPVMVLIALAIKLTSEGPVFYTQTRVGLNRRRRLPPGARYREADRGGRPFTIFKFRTMRAHVSGPDAPGQVWATPDDPRVTRLGRVLRLYRLDELPQLLNVLLGDMDLIGPRPEQPAIFTRLRDQIELYQERQRVRPGITGWAQVNLKYDSSIDDVRKKLEYDLQYIKQRSVSLDLRILLRTFPVVAGKLGAW